MKKLCILSILAVAVVASADVQIFFTDGATSPWTGAGPTGGPLAPSANAQMDWTSGGYVANFAAYPAAMSNATVGLNQTAYVWIKFTTEVGS